MKETDPPHTIFLVALPPALPVWLDPLGAYLYSPGFFFSCLIWVTADLGASVVQLVFTAHYNQYLYQGSSFTPLAS